MTLSKIDTNFLHTWTQLLLYPLSSKTMLPAHKNSLQNDTHDYFILGAGLSFIHTIQRPAILP